MNYNENKRTQEVVNGCITYIVFIIISAITWSLAFWISYDVVLTIWIKDLPPVTFSENILIGVLLSILTAKIKDNVK